MEGIIICKKCSKQFNLDNRSPIVIVCGHSCCKDCYLKQLNLEEGVLVCPFDEKKFKIPTELAQNQLVIELLKMQIKKKPLVPCKDHEDKEVEFYCQNHDKLLCSLCVWDHSDHKYSVKICTFKDIKQHRDKVALSLNVMHDQLTKEIKETKESLQIMKEKKQPISSKELNRSIKKAKDLLLKAYIQEDNGKEFWNDELRLIVSK